MLYKNQQEGNTVLWSICGRLPNFEITASHVNGLFIKLEIL